VSTRDRAPPAVLFEARVSLHSGPARAAYVSLYYAVLLHNLLLYRGAQRLRVAEREAERCDDDEDDAAEHLGVGGELA
jgi:hypothetical protein